MWFTRAMEYTPLSPTDFAAIDDLGDWRYVLNAIRAQFRAGSFTAAAALAESSGFLAEHLNNHEGRSVRRAHATIAQLADN